MKIDLSKHIVDYINRFKTVIIPGIGKFDKIHKAAGFHDNVHDLVPPKIVVEFKEDTSGNDDLAQWISVREAIDISQAQKVIQHFSSIKSKELIDQGFTKIYPLGTLSSTDSGIYFSPKNSGLINQYLGMQAIPLTPATHTEEEKRAAAPSQGAFTPTYTQEKESNSLYRWLGIAILAILLILAYKMCGLGNDTKTKSKSSTSNIEIDKSEDDFFSEIDSSSSKVANANKVRETDTKETDGSKMHIDEISNVDIDTVLESEELKKASPETIVDCVIILGAYKKQRNALRMMRDIENAGHKLYVGVNGDLTRVGLTYNCTKADLVTYIQRIRKDFVREAWYLVPELRVEYAD